ncbi:MAG: caspase family protein, partial [Deltaproteobacteria bacterium]|nr:caspase family protein [Deltaproteobacteria bacterium]
MRLTQRGLVLALVLLLAWPAWGAERRISRTAGSQAAPDSERRLALVIGNGAYKTSPLRNPVNDARAMASTLKSVGFEVVQQENLDQKQMKRAIWSFGQKIRQGGVGLFYFAGHGIQFGGRNYLIPVGARIEYEEEVEVEAVDVRYVLTRMAAARNRLNIVILDACRDNPFARSFRSTNRGLAYMDAPSGTLIAYATAPGQVASDGPGENGLFTSELISHMQTPGLKLEDVFKKVRVGVSQKSGGLQVPWESSSLMGDFYFNPRKRPSPPPAPKPRPAAETGEVEVSSNVDGALFSLAGRRIRTRAGQVMVLSQIPAGDYDIVAVRKGFQDWQGRLTVKPGQITLLNIVMERAQPAAQPPAKTTAQLVVESSPSGAEVHLDGRFKGATPLSIDSLPPGQHKIQIKKPGYEDWTETLKVAARDRLVLRPWLKKLPETKPEATPEKTPPGQDQVASLLDQAQADIEANRLTSPKDDNAFEKFQKVLEMDPANGQARAGLEKIVSRYVDLALKRLESEDWLKAERYLNRAETVLEGDPRVAEARAKLAEAKKTAAQAKVGLVEVKSNVKGARFTLAGRQYQ